MIQGAEGVFSGVMSLSRINEWVHRTRANSALSLHETHPGHQEARQRQARVEASSVRRDVCSSSRSEEACREKGSGHGLRRVMATTRQEDERPQSRALGPSALSVQPSASPPAQAWLLTLFRS